MMVALVLYAYARGVRSVRAIERACEEDVAFRVIAAQQVPDHATIARFVERHEQALAGLFGSVLALCAQAGLAPCRRRRDRRHEDPRQRQSRCDVRLRAHRA
jgi:transposase